MLGVLEILVLPGYPKASSVSGVIERKYIACAVADSDAPGYLNFHISNSQTWAGEFLRDPGAPGLAGGDLFFNAGLRGS